MLTHCFLHTQQSQQELDDRRVCMQGAKKRLDFQGRPSSAPYAAQQQAAEAASEKAASVVSCATAAGQELYERGMQMKQRQEQLRQQLRQASPAAACRTTSVPPLHTLASAVTYCSSFCLHMTLAVAV